MQQQMFQFRRIGKVSLTLAYFIGDNAKAGYRRGDLVEKCHLLMDAWQAFADFKPPDKVLSIKR